MAIEFTTKQLFALQDAINVYQTSTQQARSAGEFTEDDWKTYRTVVEAQGLILADILPTSKKEKAMP